MVSRSPTASGGSGAACAFGACYYSPFYYYGLPYIYAPDVVVVAQPGYTYVPAPSSYYGDYYLNPGARTGLNSAIDDIKNAWLAGNPDSLLTHVDDATTLAISLNGKYSYSLPGSDYRSMTSDAISHVTTSDFSIYRLEQRSDGAYTAFAKHDFTDINGKAQSAYVSYTLAKSGDAWVIVAAGSSDTKL